jgi:hypothetical protein
MEGTKPVISTVVLVAYLMLPGMSEPLISRQPMDSFEACLAKVKEAGEALKLHDGEQYRYLAGCEVTGNKADPV